MDTEQIWLGIILPLITGPICAYLMTLRNDYIERKTRNQHEKYIEERNHLYLELKNFYWPIYIQLLCIKQYSYSIPIKNKYRYESDTSNNSSESNDYSEDDASNMSNIEPQQVNDVPINNNSDDINNFQVSINIPIPNNKIHKTIILDKTTLQLLEKALSEKYKLVISIIEDYIALVCIHENLNFELINFIKYAKIREIINEGSPESEYNIEYFGVENNLDKVIVEIKQVLDKINEKYTNLIKNPL